jgi:ABC-2 type transport system ATP-binding protein
MAVIEVEGLVKVYDGRNVVDGVTFSVEQGEIFGIVGPNGAGKTTIVEAVEGLRRPDGGSIRVLGLDPIEDRFEVTERLGAQLQESRLQDKVKVREVLATYASFYRNPADWRELVDVLGLGDKMESRYGSLSGGQKQRVSVALALVGNPEIAILDELTTGLDPQARRSTWETIEAIRERGVTVVLVTHFMEEAERLCNRIMVVDGGTAVAIDTPAGLIASIGSGQRLRFTPSGPIPDELIHDVPGVTGVERRGSQIIVTGSEGILQGVSAVLTSEGILAANLSIEQDTLEDAYFALTNQAATPEEGDAT